MPTKHLMRRSPLRAHDYANAGSGANAGRSRTPGIVTSPRSDLAKFCANFPQCTSEILITVPKSHCRNCAPDPGKSGN
ncbi:MAG TPA: hypothetical protein VEA59_03450 [Patescibacteria group bacterium]|nr:hypothetical protein [Patescibacteria group bacterium]